MNGKTFNIVDLVFYPLGNTGTGFSITDEGLLSVASALDAETASVYSLEITATDRDSAQPLSSTAKVSITVTGSQMLIPSFLGVNFSVFCCS